MFLNEEELETLTGFRQKSRQIAQLKQMGIAFFVNGAGHPVVSTNALDARKSVKQDSKKEWKPSWAGKLQST